MRNWRQLLAVGVVLTSVVAIAPLVHAQIDIQELQRYDQDVRAAGSDLAKRIELHCAHAVSMAAYAVKVKNPNVFNADSGIYQALGYADKDLAELGEGTAEYARLARLIKDTRDKVEEHHQAFSQNSLTNAKMPADTYKGADKAKLKQMVLNEWKKLYPQDKVLGVRFPTAQWERKQEKEWNSAISQWQFYDNSVLVVNVIVQKDAATATVYPAYLNINHKQGNKVVVGAQTKGNAYVHRDMLLKNVKF